jgi:TolB-like protein/tRNA A-37 threonylcarbamoyl transferase component Bud32/tetratricopeptide (TPR) repeat protein
MTLRRLGRYQVLEPLGQGGMGAVYRAYDPGLRCERAIKVLLDPSGSDPTARLRLLREARAASRLLHPGICTVFDVGEDEGRTFIVMELIQGESLEQRIARGALPAADVVQIAGEVADALAAAHAQGVVHRDLKSSNVMLTSSGRAKLLDFGIARVHGGAGTATTDLTQTGALIGTPGCMAPEVLLGNVADPLADIWALGVLIHEMLTGRPPFAGRTAPETIAAVLHEPPAALPEGVPRALADLAARCLEKDPAQRIPSAAAVRAALEGRLASPVPRATPRRRGTLAWVAVAVTVTVVGLFVTMRTCAPPTAAIAGLAVMPLENLSGDGHQQYLADGMTDELITTLSQVSALRVIARGSVIGYRGSSKPVHVIARELGVQMVVEGAVAQIGDQLRITARLVRAGPDAPIGVWDYTRPFRDVLALQNELARTIADSVQVRLTPHERQRLTRRRAVDPAVYALFLRGRVAWDRSDAPGFTEARQHFEQALARDSSYAPAWAGLASATWGLSGWMEDPMDVMPAALKEAHRAVALDPDLADGHAILGTALAEYAYDWRGAERELKRAIALQPSDASTHLEYAFLLRYLGRFDEDRTELQKSLQIDPLSEFADGQTGWPDYFARRYPDAAAHFERAIAGSPASFLGRYGLALTLEQEHDYPRAIAEMQRTLALASTGEERAFLAHIYAQAGRIPEARALVDSLERAPSGYVSPCVLAIAYTGMGDRERALTLLEQGYRVRAGWMQFLKVDPRLDPLRQEPRFRALVAKMGL